MPAYECYRDGVLVERVIPETGQHDDVHVYGPRVLEREERGDRDGWYLGGEWEAAEEARQRVSDETVKGVLADVGDDPAKARIALDAELSSRTPRTTLIRALTAIVAPAPGPDAPPPDDVPPAAEED